MPSPLINKSQHTTLPSRPLTNDTSPSSFPPRTPLHKRHRNDLIRLLPTHPLPAHRTTPHTPLTILLARRQRVHQALVTEQVPAVRDGQVGEGVEADDAAALADAGRPAGGACGGG